MPDLGLQTSGLWNHASNYLQLCRFHHTGDSSQSSMMLCGVSAVDGNSDLSIRNKGAMLIVPAAVIASPDGILLCFPSRGYVVAVSTGFAVVNAGRVSKTSSLG